MKKKIFIVAAVLSSNCLLAQQDTTTTLDELVITANKYPQKQSSTGKVLTVIDRQQLEKNSGRSLTQVLNEQAGLVVNGAQNAPGTNQLVYLRGAGSAATLILVDGVPANDASGITSEFDLNHFSIDQIERIEILKGSQSVLYGSDAMAGVINIITKKQGSQKKIEYSANAAYGTYNTFKAGAGAGGSYKALTYQVAYTNIHSDGFSSARDVTGTGGFDKDGFSQQVLSWNLGLQARKSWKLRVYGQADKYSADIDDASFADDKNSTILNKNLQLGLASVQQFGNTSLNVNLNFNRINRKLDDERNIPDDPADYDPYNGRYKGNSFFAEVFSNMKLHKHVGLLVGTDLRHQSADIETTYGNLGHDSLHATLISGYASLLVQSIGGFNAEAGTRYTHHSTAGNAVTYSFNPSYLVNRQVKIFANVATGFRAPTLYNLASEYGNSGLQPERSFSLEGGIQFFEKSGKANIRFTYFNRHLKDVIIFKSLFVPPYGRYENADEQKDHGFELEAAWRPGQRWSITANYSFVDGKINTTNALTGKDTSFYNLYRRPKNSVNAVVGFAASRQLYASIGLRWVDTREDLFFNPVTYETESKQLAAYYNADVYISYQPIKSLKLYADFRNITNQLYFDLYGYNSRRFNCMFGVQFKL